MVYIWQPVFALSRSRQWFAVWGEARGAMMVRRATGHAGEALVVLEGGWAHAGGVHFRLGGAVIKEAAVPALSSLPRLDVAAS